MKTPEMEFSLRNWRSQKSLRFLYFCNIFSFNDIVKAGEDRGRDVEFHTPSPETISTINYTSGTTGNPKGAKVTHNSIILNTDVIEMLGLYLKEESDIYLS